MGDWYLYKDYTKIKLYGCELEPYKLPIYLTPRLFSLEFIRQSLNVDQVHFASHNRNQIFKIPQDVCPSVVKSRETDTITHNMLSYLSLSA